jgi:predicted nucleotidyltransferase
MIQIPTGPLLQHTRTSLPGLLALYGFGSRVQGTGRADSDLDLAVLVSGHADPVALWTLAGELADIAGCTVDLLDLRAASTVMQYQVVTTGVRWWALDVQAAIYESAILSDMTALNEARAGLLADVAQRGSVYGR